MPGIFDRASVDLVMDISQQTAEDMMRRLERRGHLCGVSSGGSIAAALEISKQVENATIVAIICDRGDRYLSSGLFKGAKTNFSKSVNCLAEVKSLCPRPKNIHLMI